jgi:hypothetical protein
MGKMVASRAPVLPICVSAAIDVIHIPLVHGFQFGLLYPILQPQAETNAEISASKEVDAIHRELTSNLQQNKEVSRLGPHADKLRGDSSLSRNQTATNFTNSTKMALKRRLIDGKVCGIHGGFLNYRLS